MAAITAAVPRKTRNRGNVQYADYKVGTGATIVQGALVNYNMTTERAVHATAAASRKFLGLATETKTGNTGGTVLCRVEWNMEAEINPETQLTGAYVGSNVAIEDNNAVTTMSDAGTAGVRVRVGELVEWVSTSSCWVKLRGYASDRDV